MKSEKVNLTFATDPDTSEFLKEFAHIYGKTQQELIDEICQDFKENVLNYMKELEQKKEGI